MFTSRESLEGSVLHRPFSVIVACRDSRMGHVKMMMMMATSIAHGSIDLNAQCAEGDYR